MKKAIFFIINIIVFLFFVGVVIPWWVEKGASMNEPHVTLKRFADLSGDQLKTVAAKRIYFGHQSVGSNIMKGLEELQQAHPELTLNIVEASEPHNEEGPVFYHSRVGKNKDPKSKIDDFEKIMDNGMAQKVDIAFFKFCYADIFLDTDTGTLLKDYREVMDRLEKKYPNVTFIHCTVPLYRKTGGIKGVIKLLMNKDKNEPRSEYNQALLTSYKYRGVFDLAKFESTRPDGSREMFGSKNFALVPLYTDDGGHLNKMGREMIAVQLIDFLSTLK